MSLPNTVVDITPQTNQIVVGLIPCQNRYYLDLIWPIVRPGVKALADTSEGEWTEFRAWSEVYGGSFQFYILYVNPPEGAKPGVNQDAFLEKLKTPTKDYAGFYALQLQQAGVHVFAAWIEPQYRKADIAKKALDFLEAQVKGMGAPYMSMSAIPELAEPLKKLGYMNTTINFRKKL